jgi:hypothetical protein
MTTWQLTFDATDTVSDLRAPDPTLIDLHEPVTISPDRPPWPAIACRMESPGTARTYCGVTVMKPLNSAYAAWFAIPCRECFPDVPPAGYSIQDDSCGEGCGYEAWQPDPHLAWQVQI